MAGKEIYVGSMMETIENKMQALADSMDATAGKMQDVASILVNMSSHQGMTQTFTSYNGDSLNVFGTKKYKFKRYIMVNSDIEFITENNPKITITALYKIKQTVTYKIDGRYLIDKGYTKLYGSVSGMYASGTQAQLKIDNDIVARGSYGIEDTYFSDVSIPDRIFTMSFSKGYTSSGTNEMTSVCRIFLDSDNELNLFEVIDAGEFDDVNKIWSGGTGGRLCIPFTLSCNEINMMKLVGELGNTKVAICSKNGEDVYYQELDAAGNIYDMSKVQLLDFYLILELGQGDVLRNIIFGTY